MLMTPLDFLLKNNSNFIVIPDCELTIGVDILITYNYYIYKSHFKFGSFGYNKFKEQVSFRNERNPHYNGVLAFLSTGQIFWHSGNGLDSLAYNEVEELSEQISYYRDTPSMWTT
jgi:hypothetical protein